MAAIHPTALVDPSVSLPDSVTIGPFCQVDEGVKLGEGVTLNSRCHLYSGTVLESGVRVWDGAVIGAAPQDRKYSGEPTAVHIGSNSHIREFATVNRGTAASGITRVGPGCLIMAYAHVAHDCILEQNVILSNSVQMGGHVHIGAHAVISGMTGIHQFVSIGNGAFVGGGLRVDRDVPPYSKALGEPLVWAGVNQRGLEKAGYDSACREALKRWYRRLYFNEAALTLSEAGDALSSFCYESADETMRRLKLELDGFFRAAQRGLLQRRRR